MTVMVLHRSVNLMQLSCLWFRLSDMTPFCGLGHLAPRLRIKTLLDGSAFYAPCNRDRDGEAVDRSVHYGHAGIGVTPARLLMLLCSPLGAVPVMLAAITPSAMRALMSERLAVDQLSPAAEAPALVSTKMVFPVRL